MLFVVPGFYLPSEASSWEYLMRGIENEKQCFQTHQILAHYFFPLHFTLKLPLFGSSFPPSLSYSLPGYLVSIATNSTATLGTIMEFASFILILKKMENWVFQNLVNSCFLIALLLMENLLSHTWFYVIWNEAAILCAFRWWDR